MDSSGYILFVFLFVFKAAEATSLWGRNGDQLISALMFIEPKNSKWLIQTVNQLALQLYLWGKLYVQKHTCFIDWWFFKKHQRINTWISDPTWTAHAGHQGSGTIMFQQQQKYTASWLQKKRTFSTSKTLKNSLARKWWTVSSLFVLQPFMKYDGSSSVNSWFAFYILVLNGLVPAWWISDCYKNVCCYSFAFWYHLLIVAFIYFITNICIPLFQ